MRLSGGQRQRLTIARAILANPSILVFDEATSALDSHTEQEILSSLKEVSAERTTLTIAHRLSTVIDADLIHVINNGRLEESGTHEELLVKGGTYARLYALQFADEGAPDAILPDVPSVAAAGE